MHKLGLMSLLRSHPQSSNADRRSRSTTAPPNQCSKDAKNESHDQATNVNRVSENIEHSFDIDPFDKFRIIQLGAFFQFLFHSRHARGLLAKPSQACCRHYRCGNVEPIRRIRDGSKECPKSRHEPEYSCALMFHFLGLLAGCSRYIISRLASCWVRKSTSRQ